jgi:hypothetical protein
MKAGATSTVMSTIDCLLTRIPLKPGYVPSWWRKFVDVNKSLTNDLLRQLKRPGAICTNDAKLCYDLIGHPTASIAMQRLGVPKSVVDCLFSTLQLAKHKVRTGYGDSGTEYGSKDNEAPMHGICQ